MATESTTILAAPIELLPAELFDAILDDVSFSAIVALWKCSKRLSKQLGTRIFGCADALNWSMLWGCTQGDIRLIRAAVSHGADASLVMVRRSKFETSPTIDFVTVREIFFETSPAIDSETDSETASETPDRIYDVSTLALAARRRHEEALRALLGLGATIDACSQTQLRTLAKAVSRTTCESMLWAVFDAGLGSKILDRFGLQFNLVRLIQKGASVRLLQAMLDRGADPNKVVRGSASRLESPLSKSIEMGSREIFELLIRRGADIHGRVECRAVYRRNDRPFFYHRPYHIPIYAAAVRIGRTGHCDMMDLCLFHGADINMNAPAFVDDFIGGDLFGNPLHLSIKPFWAYLETTACRASRSKDESGFAIDYFAAKGADLRLVERDTSQWHWIPADTRVLADKYTDAELLLHRWLPATLQKHRFFNTIDRLVGWESRTSLSSAAQDGDGSGGQLGLSQWWKAITDEIDRDLTHRRYPEFEWLRSLYRLPAYLMQMITRSYLWYYWDHPTSAAVPPKQLWRDTVLSGILLHMARFPDDFGTYAQIVISRLQVEGADINGFISTTGISQMRTLLVGNVTDDHPQAFPVGWPEELHAQRPLHGVCRRLSSIYVGNTQAKSRNRSWKSYGIKEKVKEFCKALVQLGANPHLLVDGSTALDILTKDLDNTEPSMKQYVESLAQVMRDGYKNYVKNGNDSGSGPSVADAPTYSTT